MSFSETQEFSKFDDPEYKQPKKGEEADGRKVDNPNNKLDTNLDAKNPEKKFDGTVKKVDLINSKEASEKILDHPTPDEILAQLNSSFLGSTEKPKNSTEGGAQVVEGTAQKIETTTAN